MLWYSVLALTLGLTFGIPALIQSLDGDGADRVLGAAGTGFSVIGVAGLLLGPFEVSTLVKVVASVALGLAATAAYPELTAAANETSN